MVERTFMTVVVKFFAACKERVGKEETHLSIREAQPLREVMRLLEKEYPVLQEMIQKRRLLIAVNLEMATDETIIREGDEIALLPPFSGGTGREHKWIP